MNTNVAHPSFPPAAEESAVSSGFQRTEVGVIPADWDVRTLNDLGLFMKGRGIKRDDVTDDGLACIRYGELYTRYDNYVYSPISRIPELVAQSSQLLRTGDLLFAGSGETADEIGKCVAYLGEGDAYAGGDIVILRPIGQNSLYLGHILNHAVVAEQKTRYGQGDAVVHISARNLGMVKVPLPSTSDEQNAIAEALSDVDGLLGALEALIAKKRAIKQAAMQQLLTGKTRLPGFSGEWETKRLGEIAEIEMGQSPSSEFYNTKGSGLPLIQGNADIANRRTTQRIFTTHITKRGRRGDILLSVRAPVGEVARATFDVCLGRGVCAIRFPNNFLFHYLVYLEPSWARHSKGSTFDSVNSTDVRAVVIALPNPDEQIAIATVLSDMDAEIAALEARRDKTRAIKQGMMQQLLTGRVRLVKPEAAA